MKHLNYNRMIELVYKAQSFKTNLNSTYYYIFSTTWKQYKPKKPKKTDTHWHLKSISLN